MAAGATALTAAKLAENADFDERADLEAIRQNRGSLSSDLSGMLSQELTCPPLAAYQLTLFACANWPGSRRRPRIWFGNEGRKDANQSCGSASRWCG
jgi:hypothetical protein